MIKLLRTAGTAFNKFKQLVITLKAAKAGYSAEQYAPFGTDSRPPDGMTALYVRTEANGDECIVGYLHKDLVAEIGEHRIFSTNADNVHQFSIWLRADGTVLMGTSLSPDAYTKHLAEFEALKVGFDELRSDHNTLVTLYNAHVHGGVTTGLGVSAVTPSTGTASTASVDGAKLVKIKTN